MGKYAAGSGGQLHLLVIGLITSPDNGIDQSSAVIARVVRADASGVRRRR
jgi:hypothetical protein